MHSDLDIITDNNSNKKIKNKENVMENAAYLKHERKLFD